MEENKYYTPGIDELYIGFECEKHDTYFNDSEPVSEYRQHIMCEENFDMLSCYLTQYRIKHLDKQDLIELGFKPSNILDCDSDEIIDGFEKYLNEEDRLILHFTKEHDVIIYKSHCYNNVSGNWEQIDLFRGEIKNKSELIKVLKMLGIK